jgi:hypothetical protein
MCELERLLHERRAEIVAALQQSNPINADWTPLWSVLVEVDTTRRMLGTRENA